MESHETLRAFFALLKNDFSPFLPQAVQDLPILNQNLAELADNEAERAIDIIIDWCSQRQPLGEILSDTCRQISLQHPISSPPDDLENTFRQVRTTVREKADALKAKAQDKENE